MEHARRACAFFLARLRSEISRQRATIFPGHHSGPHKWLNLVAGFVETAERYIERSHNEPVPDMAGFWVIEAEDMGNQAYELLEHMAGADADHIPHQIVAPFQRWVDGLQIENTIFFRAEHAANYELSSVEYDIANINWASDSLLAAQKAIHWPLLRVTVPGQALGMLPHFAVVAHELGHAIEDRIEVDFGKYNSEWQKVIGRVEQRVGALTRSDIILAQEILSDWVVELKSDAVAHYIAGPAFFFAFAGFLEISGRGYGIGSMHPPSITRLELLASHLGQGEPSYTSIYKSYAGLEIGPHTNSPSVMNIPSLDALFAELSQAFSSK